MLFDGTNLANQTSEMRISDIIIIYLAIGSPFAAHYFLRSRSRSSWNHVLRTGLAFLFWPGYAISVTIRVKLTKNDHTLTSSESINLDARLDKKVDEISRALEMFFHDCVSSASFLEFREILDRYLGLTFAVRFDRLERAGPFEEIIPSSAKNPELNSICINRRNRKGLESHRNRARADFVGLISKIADTDGPDSAFVTLALELTRVISDFEASREIDLSVRFRTQTNVDSSVSDVEKEVWHSQNQKLSAVSRI